MNDKLKTRLVKIQRDGYETAIHSYQLAGNITDGYNTLRGVKREMIKINMSASDNAKIVADMFSDWGVRNPQYV